MQHIQKQLPSNLPPEVIIEKTALSLLRVQVLQKIYNNNPNPTNQQKLKAARVAKAQWDKLFTQLQNS